MLTTGLAVRMQRPAALLHSDCMAKVPVDRVTFPWASWPPQFVPPQAHLSATSPPLMVSALSAHPEVDWGSVAVSAYSCAAMMDTPSVRPLLPLLIQFSPHPIPALSMYGRLVNATSPS